MVTKLRTTMARARAGRCKLNQGSNIIQVLWSSFPGHRKLRWTGDSKFKTSVAFKVRAPLHACTGMYLVVGLVGTAQYMLLRCIQPARVHRDVSSPLGEWSCCFVSGGNPRCPKLLKWWASNSLRYPASAFPSLVDTGSLPFAFTFGGSVCVHRTHFRFFFCSNCCLAVNLARETKSTGGLGSGVVG